MTQSDKDDDEILKEAKDAYKADKDHWDPIYDKARDDLKFLSDEPGAMWNDVEYRKRTKSGRPALELDYLTQYINQVQNNIRESERVIDIVPEGSDASVATAEMLKGLLRQIQYQSDAVIAYETASMFAIKSSIGYVEVDHDYADNKGFDQVLKVKRIINPFMIYPDRHFETINGMDMARCTKLEKVKVADFEKQYPKAAVVGFDADDKVTDQSNEPEILIATFYVKEIETTTIKAGKLERDIEEITVCKYKLSGRDVLEKTTFPGTYIPIVPVIGIEAWEDGERKLHSLIRKAKPGQKGYNLAQSVKLETLMKMPQASVIAPTGSVENYADDWREPAKTMVLRYDLFDPQGRPIPPPTQIMPPQIAQGFVEAANQSVNDIRSSLGMYQASVGEQGPEQSGAAIKARTIQSDLATYHFGDNLVHSITQVGRIIVGAIPTIYDTPRILHIVNDEDTPELVGINGLTTEGQEAMHNLQTGQYGVRVTVGASYSTRRQEAEKFFMNIVSGNPQLLMVAGDLLFKYSDFDGAQEMAARMKRVMPPNVTSDSNNADPQAAALAQQLQQAQAAIQALQGQLAQAQQQLKDKTVDQQLKAAQIASANEHNETQNRLGVLKTASDAQLENRNLDIKERQMVVDTITDASKLLHLHTKSTKMPGVATPHTPPNSGGVI
jgi:Phage P22-like portal protein